MLMMSVQNRVLCPTCGVPAESSGVCPACLLRGVVDPAQTCEHIGPYELIEELGRGGMGMVWLAEQTEPIRREVALKVIKAGMDTREVLARFEAERQALALMDHPGIARVLDAGVTDEGRPYFAMELVEGVPVTEFCDQERLGIDERLHLFLQICDAVQHAHQKGILHRDLKPSNILAHREPDGKPRIKVIDFGIAKAVGTGAILDTLVTQLGQVIGTPQYMSPEQASGDSHAIDTRSDVYALGILLYELLTGTTPLTVREIRHAAIDEILALIRNHEAPRPSTRVTRLAMAAPGDDTVRFADTRATTPARLRTRLRGDLDWIAVKALEKEPARRYATAAALAEDVRRHLEDEPVQARPPSPAYRMRKTFRRHRTAFIASAAVVLAMVAATAISLRLAYRARVAEKLANDRLAQAEAVPDFLVKAFRSPDPALSGREVRVADVLHQATEEARETFASQPAIRARIFDAIAETYDGLGLFDESARIRSEAVGSLAEIHDANDSALAALTARAIALRFHGDYTAAAAANLQTWNKAKATLGLSHPDTMHALFEYALCITVLGRLDEVRELALDVAEWVDPKSKHRFLMMLALGMLVREAEGVFTGAVEHYTRRVQRGVYLGLESDNENVASQMEHLARVLTKTRQPHRAKAVRYEALWYTWEKLGASHSHTIYAAQGLAALLAESGEWLAVAAIARALQMEIQGGGPVSSHDKSLRSLTQQAAGHLKDGDSEWFEGFFSWIERQHRSPGETTNEPPGTFPLWASETASVLLRDRATPKQRAAWLETALSDQAEKVDEVDPWLRFGTSMRILRLRVDAGEIEAARRLCSPHLSEKRWTDHPLHPEMIRLMPELVDTLPPGEGLRFWLAALEGAVMAGWMHAPESSEVHLTLSQLCEDSEQTHLQPTITGLCARAVLDAPWEPGGGDPTFVLQLSSRLLEMHNANAARAALGRMWKKIQQSAPSFDDYRIGTLALLTRTSRPNDGTPWAALLQSVATAEFKQIAESHKVPDVRLFELAHHLGPVLDSDPSLLELVKAIGVRVRQSGSKMLAVRWFEEAEKQAAQIRPEDDRTRIEIETNLVSAIQGLRRFADAAELRRTLAVKLERARGDADPETISNLLQLSACLMHLNAEDEAVQIAEACVSTCSRSRGPGHPVTLNARENLNDRLMQLKRFDEALRTAEEQLLHSDPKQPSTANFHFKMLARLGHFFKGRGLLEDAHDCFSQVLEKCPRETKGLPLDTRLSHALESAVDGMEFVQRRRGHLFQLPDDLERFRKPRTHAANP